MPTGTAFGADDLNVSHARVAGWRSGRSELLRQLERVPVSSLALSADEILYVPCMHLRGVEGARLANAAFESLKNMAAAAARDPPPGAKGHLPCRFSSRTRYLAWLIGLWLGGGSQEAVAIAATGVPSLHEWQRREIIQNGSTLVTVTASLVRARLAVEWLARFNAHDLELAEASLARSFGIDLQQAAAAAAAPEPPKPESRRSAGRLGDKQAAVPSRRRAHEADAEVAALGRELVRTGQDWRRLSPRGRLLLLALVSLARAPGHASRRLNILALAAAAADVAASEPGVAPVPPGPSTSVKPRTIPGARASAAEPLRKKLIALTEPATSPGAVSFRSKAKRKGADERPPLKDGSGPAQPPLPQEAEDETAIVDAPLSFQSDFGGLLFLLNAFVALGLYPDFTGTRPSKLAASPLWLIDRIGVFWFGSKYRFDPLHRWIAANSRGGLLPRDWTVEPGWCEPWKSREGAFLVDDGGRSTLWHPAGFPLADVPRSRRDRLRRRHKRSRRRFPHLPARRQERWVACLAHFLDARIRAATGDRSMGLAALAQVGEVTIAELDVTVRFSFEPQTVRLRVAGLDRNPAWQPAEGRSFRFSFS